MQLSWEMKSFKIRRLKNTRILQSVQLIKLFGLNSENRKVFCVVWKSGRCMANLREMLLLNTAASILRIVSAHKYRSQLLYCYFSIKYIEKLILRRLCQL